MRDRHLLNGRWNFRVDPKDEGERNRWFDVALPDAEGVEVPHIWQREEAYVNYCGAAWYERTFAAPEIRDNERLFLRFGAVDFSARVWLNGRYIGEHEGGFTPFEFDITDHIQAGDNRLTVRVYDPQDNAEIPIGKQGSWYTRVSGIWQDVYIEARNSCHIESIHVFPDVDREEVRIKVTLSGMNASDIALKAAFTIRDHEQPESEHTTATESIQESVQELRLQLKDAKLWSPEQPHLYDLVVELLDEKKGQAVDTFTVHFGMRKIEYADGQILLNGRPIFIRGALDQAYYPDTIYNPPSDEWIKNEIQLAKELGFNLLRKHIKVEVPRYLYWADRMGMLIWAEPPNVVKWSEQSRTRFYNELRGMIERDMNHPSIIIWSLYNEEWGLEWDLANDTSKQRHVHELYEHIKGLDPTRLICDNSGWIHVKTDLNDYHRYFTLPEQNEEWKHDLDDYISGNPRQNYVEDCEGPTGEPIVISEFGVWGLPDINKIIEQYGGHPPWFSNLGDDTHQEDFKKPLTALQNFERYQLDDIVGDFAQLAKYSQRRMYRAVQATIEEMRKRPQINGYVVTEFTDVEWETNGWLDADRNKKYLMEHAARFNGPLVVMVDGLNRNMWCGDEQKWDVVISNHDLHNLQGKIEWELVGTDVKGQIEINEGQKHHVRLPGAIQFVAPNIDRPSAYTLQLTLTLNDRISIDNEVELTISPEAKLQGLKICPYQMDERFRDALARSGAALASDERMHEASVVITSVLDAAVLQYYRDGGKVIFLAEDGDHLTEKGMFTFRQLDEGESWNRASSFQFVDRSFFEHLPLQPEMGWELEGIFPDYIIPFSNYSKLGGTLGRTVYMFGNEQLPLTSEIKSLYFQGWIGQAGGSLLVQRSEQGSMIVTTWKLQNNYGQHPIATHILHALLEK